MSHSQITVPTGRTATMSCYSVTYEAGRWSCVRISGHSIDYVESECTFDSLDATPPSVHASDWPVVRTAARDLVGGIRHRVEAAVTSRGLQGPLADQWRDVVWQYGADSNPALGCLLALVREAWGACRIMIDIAGAESAAVRVFRMVPSEYFESGLVEIIVYMVCKLPYSEALVATLEAAPRGGFS